jgi:hypothetical protein
MHEAGSTRLFLVVPGSYFVPEVDPFQAYPDIFTSIVVSLRPPRLDTILLTLHSTENMEPAFRAPVVTHQL